MKRLLVILLVFISIYGKGQISPAQVQAKRGVFTERLQVHGQWIDRVSTDLNTPDSANGNVLATGKAVADFLRPRASQYIQNQFSAAQPASMWMQGKAAICSLGEYWDTLSYGLPAQVYATYSDREQGFSVQRSSNDKGPASMVFFKNNAADLNTLNALQPGDKIGSLSFAAHTGDKTKVANVMDMHGLVEKTAPAYLSSGFVFNTTDTAGNSEQRMWLNASGNLLLGNETANPYKLNVANGDVRFNSLAGSGDVLVGVNYDGTLHKVQCGENMLIYDGYLLAAVPDVGTELIYTAVLSQTSQHDLVVHELENGNNTEIVWARVSPGVYTGTIVDGPGFYQNQLLHAEATDDAGNRFRANMVLTYDGNNNVYTLTIKDDNVVNTDGWTNISIEMRGFEYF